MKQKGRDGMKIACRWVSCFLCCVLMMVALPAQAGSDSRPSEQITMQESESLQSVFSVRAISYDFSKDLGWGFGSSPVYDLWPAADVPRWVDTEYLRLDRHDQAYLVQYPEDWCKGWIRLEVMPEHSLTDAEGTEAMTSMAEDALFMSDLYLTVNSIRGGLFWKPALVFAGTPESKQQGREIWYLEFVMLAEGMSEAEVEEAIEEAMIWLNVDAFRPVHEHLDRVQVNMEGIVRERYDDERRLTFRLADMEPCPLPEPAGDKRTTPYCSIPWVVRQQMLEAPEDFAAYALHLEVDNGMPWGVYTVFGQVNHSDAWLMYNRSDDDFLGLNDLLPGETDTLDDFVLVVRRTALEGITPMELAASLGLEITFSTEFAGDFLVGDRNKTGYSGPRFCQQVEVMQ